MKRLSTLTLFWLALNLLPGNLSFAAGKDLVAASRAGLQAGDFLQQLNGHPVKNLAGFWGSGRNVFAGQSLKLNLIRNYQHQTIEISTINLLLNL